MTRLTPEQPEQTKASVKGTLDELAARRGPLGPMVLTMANERSHLDRKITERVSLAVQEWLGGAYCIAAHSDAARALGQVAAALAEIADDDVETLRRFDYRDEQIADVVGLVALNVLTGSFNLVAGIEPADERQRCLSAA
jgi:AhpD family alkylhydroperoxidase